MKILGRSLILLLALSVFVPISSAQAKVGKKATPKPVKLSVIKVAEAGTTVDQVYTNTLLGLTISIPDGWNVLVDDVNKDLLEAAKEKITANKSKTFTRAMDKSMASTRILFQAANTEPVGMFLCGIESNSAGQTLASYTKFNKDLILSSNPGSKVTRDIYEKRLAGSMFKSFEVERPLGGQTQKQTYFVTARRGFLFFFVLTYIDEDGEQAMQDSLATMKLGK